MIDVVAMPMPVRGGATAAEAVSATAAAATVARIRTLAGPAAARINNCRLVIGENSAILRPKASGTVFRAIWKPPDHR